MDKFTKILVTLVVVGLFIVFFAVFTAAGASEGRHTPGIIGLVLFAGLIGALRAIWKKKGNKTNNDKNDDNNSVLQK